MAALSDDVLAGLVIVPDYADALGKAITTGKLDVPYDAISLAQLSAWPTVKSEYGGYEPTPHLALIATLYLLLTKRADSLNSDARAMRVVEVLAQTGLDERWLRRLPWSIALPIHEAIRQSRVNPGNRQSLQVYHVLDRMDIAAQMGLGFKPITMDPVMPHITAVSRQEVR